MENSGAGAWGCEVDLAEGVVPCAPQFRTAKELANAKRQQIAPPRICQYERLFTVAAIRRFSHRMMPQKISLRNLGFVLLERDFRVQTPAPIRPQSSPDP